MLPALAATLLGCGNLSSRRVRGGGSQVEPLMSFAEYVNLEHEVPYVLHLEHDDGELVYFGIRHTRDPDDRQLADLEARWAELQPSVAFNEGGDPPTANSRDVALTRFGEAGLIRYLAARDDIPVLSLDPARESEVELLLRSWGPEQIKLFYVLREIPQIRGTAEARSPEAHADMALEWLGQLPGLAGPPTNADELTRSARRLLPALHDWREIPQEWFDPALPKDLAFTNTISRQLARFRDEHMVELLVEQVRGGQRVFAVVGASHVVMQERALRALLAR